MGNRSSTSSFSSKEISSANHTQRQHTFEPAKPFTISPPRPKKELLKGKSHNTIMIHHSHDKTNHLDYSKPSQSITRFGSLPATFKSKKVYPVNVHEKFSCTTDDEDDEFSESSEDEEDTQRTSPVQLIPNSREVFQALFKKSEKLLDELSNDAKRKTMVTNNDCILQQSKSTIRSISDPVAILSRKHSVSRRRSYSLSPPPKTKGSSSSSLVNLGNNEIAIIVTRPTTLSSVTSECPSTDTSELFIRKPLYMHHHRQTKLW
ncbi:hypothetical protein C9374_005568 [Naegleria lovaniensis]|uniref:Uncharacterized protein n=1 Tax=Naegleria lovaniensis TaxID=51637 RepID=A0AA88GJZ6_NAELO|nr:uncharacterized protein C9374_005568 [Naegleria lovaniensis]KAG2382366.1 hypothetical protein C9374_005568 [Naegleria lovaniensis]